MTKVSNREENAMPALPPSITDGDQTEDQSAGSSPPDETKETKGLRKKWAVSLGIILCIFVIVTTVIYFARVPVLIAVLKSDNAKAIEFAKDSLIKIGPDAVPALIQVTKDEDADEYVQIWAAFALIELGSDAVPSLSEALRDGDEGVRTWTAIALGRIGSEAKDAVPTLIATLKDENVRVRGYAAEALGQIGPAAKDAIPALIEALKDEGFDVRQAAAEALKKIRGEE